MRIFTKGGGRERMVALRHPMNIAQTECSDLLTSEDVIRRLCQDSALRRAAITCVLPAVRSADGWRFRHSDLEAWILKQKATAS